MTVAETILVFAGIPLAIIAVLALLIFVPGGRKRARYKSGQPWEHAPIWYEPHPDGPAAGHGCARRASRPARPAHAEPGGPARRRPRHLVTAARDRHAQPRRPDP